jgi:hypothetical protein
MPLKQVDWDKFIFRSHYFGELMTPARGKTNLEKYTEAQMAYEKKFTQVENMKPGSVMDRAVTVLSNLSDKVDRLKPMKDIPNLSSTCKRRLAQIYTEETTGRVKDIESMYIEKGLKTEEDSITLYSLRTGTMYKKNKERISNEYVSGEIDFDDDPQDMVIDTKSSFDIFTFDATVAQGIRFLYEWQGHCYMWLKNRKNFRLAYCLNNTPGEILEKLYKRLLYSFVGSEQDYKEACELLKQKHTYDDLPLERKIRVYDLKRDDEKIELAKSYVPYFRDYLKSIDNVKIDSDEWDEQETE